MIDDRCFVSVNERKIYNNVQKEKMSYDPVQPHRYQQVFIATISRERERERKRERD
ncbi:uncharacterized protein LACBIDRAFT_306977 [Laccaria bicolor S238N-H82]|uniref:Predicted protein n=1 Tax=Laccaria bicolor (strain S238N-H82 / ATCC MYA-4686) TaxID=486041 RepID=B0DP32_LACBS|nr:uncharacterized protein LACBIDRAFT_306977 [Laccaria bicolor S238N-H82]EDR03616.1 predicted protein [Laccaria bicolor S238N-H82]|eukprot:XP_001885764.1 predicted protein [Laccaria bicolor S238N-H82]